MPEHSLKALTPLGLSAPRSDRIGGIDIAENVSRALASLACRMGREGEFAAAIDEVLGLALPGPGKSVANDRFRVIWTGPGQFLVDAPFDTHEDMAPILKDGFGDCASVTEQTDAWARFELSGAACPALLERLSAVDIERMAPGDAARTIMDHLGVFLICHEAGRRYTVLGPRSAAGSLHHALTAAARSIA